MANAQQKSQTDLLLTIREFLNDFETKLNHENLRERVLALIPVVYALRELGSSLVPAASARDRILLYLQKYARQILSGDELLVVSGIGEWARRVRELRVEFGWNIASGQTINEMIQAEDNQQLNIDGLILTSVKPNDYILLKTDQDTQAAYRWHVANDIRKMDLSVRDKILAFLRANVGKVVTGEELRYLADENSEWARRIRELRTEEGWPVYTRQSGRRDLAVGEYVLEMDRQSPRHDRVIPDNVRRIVLKRDNYSCQNCGWDQSQWRKEDSRLLELHHIKPHVQGGANTEDNLTTLCNVCHDQIPVDK